MHHFHQPRFLLTAALKKARPPLGSEPRIFASREPSNVRLLLGRGQRRNRRRNAMVLVL